MPQTTCPIWNTPADKLSERDYGDKVTFDSVRAGGRYEVANTARRMISELGDDKKAVLTTWILDQNRLGDAVPTITDSLVKDVSKISNISVRDSLDRLVLGMGHAADRPGQRIELRSSKDQRLWCNVWKLMAWTECVEDDELWYLIDSAAEEGLVREGGYQGGDFFLTPKGYGHLDQLFRGNRGAPQAFVAMWFHDTMSEAYTEGFERAIREAGYRPLRIDQKEHINKIDDEIIAEIRRSRFLVADFTSEQEKPRGGVYFEAGFAYGLNIPVIWTCREDAIGHVHFDTRQFNHIVWSSHEELRKKLKNRIEAVIGDGPLKQAGLKR